MEEVCTICSVGSWNAEDFFFSLPVCGRKLLSCLMRGSQQMGHVWLFLFLMACGRLIGYLSILPMTYQRFSPSSFPFLLDGDLDSP